MGLGSYKLERGDLVVYPGFPGGGGTRDDNMHWVMMKYKGNAGTDPGFPVGGGASPPEGGANLCYCQNFPKKLHEIENILGHRGRARGAPLDPPL